MDKCKLKIKENIISYLISKKAFSYYDHDIYLVYELIKYVNKKHPKVLDVGCGIGHYSFLFERAGAKVTAFDYNADLINRANSVKSKNKSKVQFLVADGRYPDRYFKTDNKFDIIFMSGFSLFAKNLDNKELMIKYLSLLEGGGKLIFIQNSNLSGTIRRTNIKDYHINELKIFFEDLDCKIDKIYFYDRHFFGRILRSMSFSEFSKIMHLIITRITGLPCNIVLIISRRHNIK